MIWEWHAPSHWICKDFAVEGEHLSHGYIIHARCRKKKKAKTVFDTVPESWVEQLSLNNKIVKHFKKEPHIITAMEKAALYVKACLELQDKIQKMNSVKVSDEQLENIKEGFKQSIDNSTNTYETPIIDSTESNDELRK